MLTVTVTNRLRAVNTRPSFFALPELHVVLIVLYKCLFKVLFTARPHVLSDTRRFVVQLYDSFLVCAIL